jgi:5-formyltetrahydrofolate cyclo-ligase
MHGQRLAEGAGFAHQYAAALAQGAVDGFDNIGLAFAL